jgi:hypothetical protein
MPGPWSELLAEFDDALGALLRRELEVAVGYDAPERGWSGDGAAIGLFLYAVEEVAELRSRQWATRRDGEQARRAPAPVPLAATYALTAWAGDVREEHALLSSALAVLHAYPVLPADVLGAGLADARVTVTAPIAAGAPARDLWSTLGGPSKLAIALRATAALDAGPAVARGPVTGATRVTVAPRAAS